MTTLATTLRRKSKFSVRSRARSDAIEITSEVNSEIQKLGVSEALVNVQVEDGACAISVASVMEEHLNRDLFHVMDRLIPFRDAAYRSRDENSSAHIKSTLVGGNKVVEVSGGRLQLFDGQGIFLLDFEGPDVRTVHVSIFSS
ncbi:MAG: secondary thiamine-phosphate synthase enzyme YjbQ [Planctomycetes bacterium]|nr:secondary thiamine-phosphate synthase enzyme YjbQ [Planctomycetota bacterium]